MSITKTAKQKLSVFIRAVPFMTDFSKKDIFNSTIKRHSTQDSGTGPQKISA